VSVEAAWAAEIRAALLGRFRAKNRRLGDLDAAAQLSADAHVVRRWWTFEGHRYAPLDGPLGERWEPLTRAGERLLATFNPELRRGERPEGPIDWPSTLASGGALMWPGVYVSHASKVGLGAEERGALLGWARWIVGEWRGWCKDVKELRRADEAASLARWGGAEPGAEPPLARWAAVAMRSRWALLREVVAETLRHKLEPQLWVDQLPLPAEREQLFELLCMARLIEELGGRATHVRMLDHHLNRNRLTLEEDAPQLVRHQHSVPAEEMLRSALFDGGLREAMWAFKLRKPRRIDLLFELDRVRHGFDAIIVEVKSGAQDPAGALWQLRAYRDALAARGLRRCVVWIIAEQRGQLTPYEQAWLAEQAAHSAGDVWVVSDHDSIPTVIAALGVSEGCAGGSGA
jgi:hypothetical protein